jgi:hypothetical protein
MPKSLISIYGDREAMNSEFARFEMDADRWADYEAWVQARREMKEVD